MAVLYKQTVIQILSRQYNRLGIWDISNAHTNFGTENISCFEEINVFASSMEIYANYFAKYTTNSA